MSFLKRCKNKKKWIREKVREIVRYEDVDETVDEDVVDYLFHQFGFIFDKTMLESCIQSVVKESIGFQGISLKNIESNKHRLYPFAEARTWCMELKPPSKTSGMQMENFLKK